MLVAQTIKVTSEYTLNLYHTTSSIMVNGKQELNFINTDLPQFFTHEENNQDEIQTLNAQIRKTIQELTEPTENENPECRKCERQCKSNCVLCQECQHWVHFHCEHIPQKDRDRIKCKGIIYKCSLCQSKHTEDKAIEDARPEPTNKTETHLSLPASTTVDSVPLSSTSASTATSMPTSLVPNTTTTTLTPHSVTTTVSVSLPSVTLTDSAGLTSSLQSNVKTDTTLQPITPTQEHETPSSTTTTSTVQPAPVTPAAVHPAPVTNIPVSMLGATSNSTVLNANSVPLQSSISDLTINALKALEGEISEMKLVLIKVEQKLASMENKQPDQGKLSYVICLIYVTSCTCNFLYM